VDNPGPFATMAVLPAVVTNTLLFLGLQTFRLEFRVPLDCHNASPDFLVVALWFLQALLKMCLLHPSPDTWWVEGFAIPHTLSVRQPKWCGYYSTDDNAMVLFRVAWWNGIIF